jgi:hypothetical protein
MSGNTTIGSTWRWGAALTGLMVAALLCGGDALARVGVTSASDGDPLGKPPNENERILRIGIDVQADELITTAANDRAHLVFLDGSSLTVGPNARLSIDKFVYDPNAQKGELAINATKGVFRLVGGKISKSNPITITTPSSTIGIRGGITIFTVNRNQTVAGFVFGNSMTVTADGRTQTATRAGSQITTNVGGPPGAAVLLKAGALAAAFSQLEGTSSNNGSNTADQAAQSSGFSSKNSGAPLYAPNFNQNAPPNPSNNTLTNAVSNTNPAGQPAGNTTPQNTTKTTITTTSPGGSTNQPPSNNSTPPVTTNPTPTPNNNQPNNNNPTPASQTRTGFVGGLVMESGGGEGDRNYNSWSSRVSTLPQPSSISVTTNPANSQATSTIVIGLHESRHDSATVNLQLGGPGASTLTNNNYTMTTNLSQPSTLQIGDRTRQINAESTLASISNPGTCTCEFLSWGAWASTVADPRNDRKTYTAIGTYVVGTPSVQLPTTGSATYNGFMAGFANNNGNINSAIGTYQNTWNFRTGSGSFNGTFDGTRYTGNTYTTGGLGSVTFAGNFNGRGGRFGALNGSFFSSPSDAAAYQAGTFSIGSRSGYQASGIFAGQR